MIRRAAHGLGNSFLFACVFGLLGAAPASATSLNLGTGAITAGLHYTNAGGVPPLRADCNADDFTVTAFATLAVKLRTDLSSSPASGFAGRVDNIAGTGHGTCEKTSLGMGTLDVSVPPTPGPVSGTSIACDGDGSTTLGGDGSTTLHGAYTREAQSLEAVLNGVCVVNGDPVPVSVVVQGLWEPEVGSGISGPTTNASLSATIVVLPF
jgi:hypothetical protein